MILYKNVVDTINGKALMGISADKTIGNITDNVIIVNGDFFKICSKSVYRMGRNFIRYRFRDF